MLKKNIWTSSNVNFDLCRYTGCKFIFYKHPYIDFVLSYKRQYPLSLSFADIMNCHPYMILQSQHKIIIPSMKHNPKGKPYVKKKMKPPKQMTNKWFFQDMFSDKPLILLTAAVCDLSMPYLGPSGENTLISLTCLNIHNCYDVGNWGAPEYKPYSTFTGTKVKYKPRKASTETEFQLGSTGVGYSDGWFSKQLLQAEYIAFTQDKKVPPVYYARYNPAIDDGVGNSVYLCSVSTSDFNKPASDKVLIASNKPLWMLLFGFVDYVRHIKRPVETMSIYYLVIETKYIHATFTGTRTYLHIPLDLSFIEGKGPYNSLASDKWLTRWYPTLVHQQQSMNNIVKAGPFIPKPDPTKANWELHYNSTFFLSGEEHKIQPKQLQTPLNNLTGLLQITSNKQYKQLIRKPKSHKACYTPGTLEEDQLQKQLLKECTNTYQLNNLLLQMEKTYHQRKKQSIPANNQYSKKKKQKTKHVSTRSSKKIPAKKRKKTSSPSDTSSNSSSSSSKTSNTTSYTSSQS